MKKIQCINCKRIINKPYKDKCQNCYKLQKHLESELIYCVCGCKELIHSISRKGKITRLNMVIILVKVIIV